MASFINLSTIKMKAIKTVTRDINEETASTCQDSDFKPMELDYLPNDAATELNASCLRKLPICLGKGHSGVVYLGCLFNSSTCSKEVVAIKMPKNTDAPEEELEIERKSVRDEIKMLAYIGNHENVLQLKGAVTKKKDRLWIALEYCELGSLKKFLAEKKENKMFRDSIDNHSDETMTTIYKMLQMHVDFDQNGRSDGFLSTVDLLSFAMQIANGMDFLHGKGIVHRDLALRNILLTIDYKIKIADFGLSRQTRDGYYTRTLLQNQAIPYFWTAPEALTSSKVLLKSDLWTFGVVLWELFELGTKPYAGLSGAELLPFLHEGNRLEQPFFCPIEMNVFLTFLPVFHRKELFLSKYKRK